jgi:hypothetical protein
MEIPLDVSGKEADLARSERRLHCDTPEAVDVVLDGQKYAGEVTGGTVSLPANQVVRDSIYVVRAGHGVPAGIPDADGPRTPGRVGWRRRMRMRCWLR